MTTPVHNKVAEPLSAVEQNTIPCKAVVPSSPRTCGTIYCSELPLSQLAVSCLSDSWFWAPNVTHNMKFYLKKITYDIFKIKWGLHTLQREACRVYLLHYYEVYFQCGFKKSSGHLITSKILELLTALRSEDVLSCSSWAHLQRILTEHDSANALFVLTQWYRARNWMTVLSRVSVLEEVVFHVEN